MGLRTRIRHPGVQEGLWAAIYSVGLLLSTLGFIEAAWVTTDHSISAAVFNGIAGILGASTTVFGLLGLWFGLTVAWLFDTYRRRLTFVPFLVGSVALIVPGFRVVLEGASVTSVLIFLVVAIGCAYIGGLPSSVQTQSLNSYLRLHPLIADTQERSRNAPKLTFIAVGLIVGLGLLDVVLGDLLAPTNTSVTGLVWALGSGTILLYCLYRLLRYHDELRIMQIGPPRSGKTTVLGGLYTDAPHASTESETLKDIQRHVANDGTLPNERTRHDALVEFSYTSDRWVFKRRYSVTGFDHKGELLTSGPGDLSIAELIKQHRQTSIFRNASFVTRLKHRLAKLIGVRSENHWQRGIELLEQDDPTMKNLQKVVARLVDGADLILFTIPLDDFLRPVLQRGHEQAYFGVARVERGDAEQTYEITLLQTPNHAKNSGDTSESESFTIVREKGDLYYAESGERFELFSFESFDALPRLDEETSYCVLDRSRVASREYYKEYDELLDLFEDDVTKSFAWVATMTDLVEEDFKQIYNRTRSQLDSDSDVLEDLQLDEVPGAFETAWPGVVTSSSELQSVFAYKLLSEWVQREYIGEKWNSFCGESDDTLLSKSGEDFVYPVWFDIDAEESHYGESLRINTGADQFGERAQQVLLGSDRLLERLEGQRLEDNRLFDQTSACYEALYRYKNSQDDSNE